MEEYILITRFKIPAMTVGEYIQFSKRILIELAEFDDCFKNMHGWGSNPKSWSGFNPAWSDFEEIVLKQIEDPEIRYENPDPENWNLTLDSKSFTGFLNSYSNTKKHKDGQITIIIHVGKNENETSYLNIQFPEFNYPEFKNPNFVTQLLKKCISLVDPLYAVAITHQFIEKVEKHNQDNWIGWITYIANPDLSKHLSNVNLESFHHGIIIQIAKKMVYSTDTSAVEKAIQIRDHLSNLQ